MEINFVGLFQNFATFFGSFSVHQQIKVINDFLFLFSLCFAVFSKWIQKITTRFCCFICVLFTPELLTSFYYLKIFPSIVFCIWETFSFCINLRWNILSNVLTRFHDSKLVQLFLPQIYTFWTVSTTISNVVLWIFLSLPLVSVDKIIMFPHIRSIIVGFF